ncbi:MAG TPA: hypothetical protein VIT64_02110, partial [Ilumatobacteraceae bacterium]
GTGFTVGGLGAAGAVGAAVLDNVPGLFVSLHRRRRNRNLLAGPIRRHRPGAANPAGNRGQHR